LGVDGLPSRIEPGVGPCPPFAAAPPVVSPGDRGGYVRTELTLAARRAGREDSRELGVGLAIPGECNRLDFGRGVESDASEALDHDRVLGFRGGIRGEADDQGKRLAARTPVQA